MIYYFTLRFYTDLGFPVHADAAQQALNYNAYNSQRVEAVIFVNQIFYS